MKRNREDNIKEMSASLIAKASAMLDVDREMVQRHLQKALDEMNKEIDSGIMKDYGIAPAPEVQSIMVEIQKGVKEYLDEWASWYFEKMIRQFQRIATDQVRKISNATFDSYKRDGSITLDKLMKELPIQANKN